MPKRRKKQYTDNWLWFWRTERGLPMDQLAPRVGLSKVFLNNVERGHRKPSRATAEAIADELGVEVGDLFPPPGAPTPREVIRAYLQADKKHRAQVRERANRPRLSA